MTYPILLDEEAIQAEVRRLGAELSAAYDDGVVLVGLLKGSVVFLADLVRAMTTKSASLRESTAAFSFASISGIGITRLPARWPQRFGHA